MLTIAFCEDNPIILKKYIHLTNMTLSQIHIRPNILTYTSGEELLFKFDHTNVNQIDIIFMDIHLKKINGIQTMTILRNMGYEGLLIYLTNIKEFVFQSFVTKPNDFLIKGDNEDNFKKALLASIDEISQNKKNFITISTKTTHHVFNTLKITYIEVKNKTLEIHHQNDDIIFLNLPIQTMESHLKNTNLIRIHKSYIANLNYIRTITPKQIILFNNLHLPIGRKYAQLVRERGMSVFHPDL